MWMKTNGKIELIENENGFFSEFIQKAFKATT